MNRRRRALRFAELGIAVLLLMGLAAPAEAGVRNLTAENEKALLRRIGELSRSELWRSGRGRSKASPVPLPFFTIYQDLIVNPDVPLREIQRGFASSLERMDAAAREIPPADAVSGEVVRYFRSELVRMADLSKPIAERDTFYDLWLLLQQTEAGMELLPLRTRIALRTWQWTVRRYEGTPPEAVKVSFLAMIGQPVEAATVSDLPRASGELSARHARWLLRVVRGEVP